MFTIPKKLKHENNKEYSYRVLKDAIMSLQLKPGQAISEIDVAEALQISRTPIREVMVTLREENLVEVRPQIGTYVTKIDPKLIEEAAFMRYTLEREVLRLSCERFPDEYLFELKKNVSLQEQKCKAEGNAVEFHALDNEFHRTIFQGNQKENVWKAITRLSTHYNRIRLLSEIEHRFDLALEQHNEIIQIIESKQVDKVDEFIREHIVEPTKKWEVLFAKDSPYTDCFEYTHKMPVF